MRGVWIPLEHRVKMKLIEAAEREHREPKWQASVLIERALFGEGLATSDTAPAGHRTNEELATP